jgi:hypothetical protein
VKKIACLFLVLSFAVSVSAVNLETLKATYVSRLPQIDPDYTQITIPPNIAPLNFMIREPGSQYIVKIYAKNAKAIVVASSSAKIMIPIKPWQALLKANTGEQLCLDVYVCDGSRQWNKYQTIVNQIAPEGMDSYLAYRLIHPGFNTWTKMGIYQRNLENFDEEPILINRLTEHNCMNCHNFQANDPDNMCMHLRTGPAGGTLLIHNGQAEKIDTKTEFNRAGAYPAWHPSGKAIAFAVINLTMFFHNIGEPREVLDGASDVILYLIDSNTVTTGPAISDPERMETFPNWSPDGRYLYFCSAPKMENFLITTDGQEDLHYKQIKYDLQRVSFDIATGTWGKLETLISADKTGLSAAIPRVSPDGRYAIVTMAAWGTFPIYMESADLYLLDLNDMNFTRMDISSDRCDSYHCWSSNGRWFVFSSKRLDGLCARPYFCYFDQQGNAHKPFIMPQKDPEFYLKYINTYNIPELVKGKVKYSPRELQRIMWDKKIIPAKLDEKIIPRQSTEETLYQSGVKKK